MPVIDTVRRLAADIMHVGQNKIRISPEGFNEAKGALTRSDVKGLIERGIIKKLPPQGRASTGRAGRIGRGHRKGTPVSHKEAWMEKVRAQRRFLFMLVSSGVLKEGSKRMVYQKVKSGIFRNKRAMLVYLQENKLVPADYEVVKAEYVKKEQKQKAKKAPAAQIQSEAKPAQKPVHGAQAAAPHEAKEQKKGEQR